MSTKTASSATPVDPLVIQRLVEWRVGDHGEPGNKRRLDLVVNQPDGSQRCVANVWENGIWHTWDQDGVGGENDKEETVARAKIEAAASAIQQGFV